LATKFVSTARGNDTTGDGSASNPWKTIGKAIGSGYTSWRDNAAANTLYIEPGLYREAVTLGASPTSSGPLTIRGDYDGAGFTAGGYGSAATGLVDWRAWTSDTADITGSCLAASSKNYVTVERIKFIGGHSGVGSCVDLTTSTNWTFTACEMIGGYTGGGICIQAVPTAGVALDMLVDGCVFFTIISSAPAIRTNSPFNASEWSLGVTVRNCVFQGAGFGVQAFCPTGGGISGGGIAIQSCSFVGVSRALDFYYTRTATITTYPCTIYGCNLMGTGMNAGTGAAVTSDGNNIATLTAYTNITGGAHDKTTLCPAINAGDWIVTATSPRPFGEPAAVSPIAGFGNYGTVPTVDVSGQDRPATAAAGALEVDTFDGGGGGGGGGGGSEVISKGASMGYSGDFGRGQLVVFPFHTADTLTSGVASVLRDDGVKGTAGVTLRVDQDSTTGRNAVAVDTGASSTFYLDGHDYEVSITGGTVGGDSAADLVGSFSIRNRPDPVKSTAIVTSGIKSVGG